MRCAVLALVLAGCGASTSSLRTLRLPSDDDVVSVHVAIRAGSVDDPVGREGLTHLMLHAMREGGAGRFDAFALRERLFDTAAELDVQVDREVSVITLRAHRDTLEDALPLLEAMLVAPRFDVRTFDRLRRDGLDSIRHALRGTEEEWLAEEALTALVYAGHPYGHPVIGTEAGLSAISLGDLTAHRDRIVCATRAVVGVTGRAPEGLEARLAALVPEHARCAARAALPAPRPTGPRVLLVSHPDAAAATVRMLAPYAVTRAHPAHPALVLFAGYFGLSGQFIGRLMQTIREQRGLSYGAYAYAEHIEPGGGRGPAAHAVRSQQAFEIVLRPMSPEHIPFVVRLVMRELDAALTDVPDEGLRAVAGFLDGYLPLLAETADARLGSALDQAYFGLDVPYGEMLRGAFARLDADEVAHAARTFVEPSAMHVVVVTPDALALRDALLAERIPRIAYDHPAIAEDDAIVAYPLGLLPSDVAIVDVETLFVR